MKRFKLWRLKRDFVRGQALLRRVDVAMKTMGLPRHLRRQLWNDFRKSPERRMDLFDTVKDAMK